MALSLVAADLSKSVNNSYLTRRRFELYEKVVKKMFTKSASPKTTVFIFRSCGLFSGMEKGRREWNVQSNGKEM